MWKTRAGQDIRFNEIRYHQITVRYVINALPGNSFVNTVQHATVDEAVFSISSAPSSGGTRGLYDQFLSNGSVNNSA
jgi:hypothetical protein